MGTEELKEIAFDKIDIHWNDFSEGSYKAVNRLRDECFIAGYNEAMRWRDPVNDPPKCNDLMLIKYGDTFIDIVDYSLDRYLEDAGMWDIEQSVNIKVIAWRPIE